MNYRLALAATVAGGFVAFVIFDNETAVRYPKPPIWGAGPVVRLAAR